MTIFEAIILGLVQGLTEFLPVSSSGHLIIFQNLFGMEEPMLTFDIFLHIGTLVAVFIVFWKDIWRLLKKPFCKEVALLIVATIPVGIIGLLFDDKVAAISTLTTVGICLIFTGVILFFSDRLTGRIKLNELSFGKSLFIGLMQGIAVLPGVSRSGSTICASLLCGLDRKEAARYSFLLSILAILGAGLVHSLGIIQEHGSFSLSAEYIAGMAAAALSGFAAIKFFLKLLEKKSMRFFSYYCWSVAAIILIWNFVA